MLGLQEASREREPDGWTHDGWTELEERGKGMKITDNIINCVQCSCIEAEKIYTAYTLSLSQVKSLNIKVLHMFRKFLHVIEAHV